MYDDIKALFEEADPFRSWWPFIIAGLVFLVSTIKSYMGGQICPSENLITDFVVLITGGNGGIGQEIVRELSKRGGIIIMCCRNIENGEKVKKQIMKRLKKVRIDVRQLDLRSFDDIQCLVKSIEADYSKIDILINNAGVTLHPFRNTSDGFETHLQVNYLGHFMLTHLLTPMLIKSKQGRIINVSGHAYAAGQMCINDPLWLGNLAPEFHPRDAYSHSKLAINLWSRKLANLLKSTPITVNCLTPGFVRGTNHFKHSLIMRAISARIIMFPCMWVFMKTSVMGAQTAIYLATDEKIKETSGKYFNDCEISDVTELVKDKRLEEKLYIETLRVLKLDAINV